MRSGRIPLFAFAALALLAILAGGVLLSSGEREGSERNRNDGASTRLGQFVPVSPPRALPPLGFTDTTGRPVSLADFAGKVVLINLWATWCAPCRHEMPSLDRLQVGLGDKIAIVAISEDLGGNKVVAPFIEKLGLRAVKIYLDPKSKVGAGLKVVGLPTSILIDRIGRMVGRVDGEADWTSSELLAVIEPLLSADGIVKTSLPQAHP